MTVESVNPLQLVICVIQLQLIPSVRGHIDAARQFVEMKDFYSAIEHLGEAIEVRLVSSSTYMYVHELYRY